MAWQKLQPAKRQLLLSAAVFGATSLAAGIAALTGFFDPLSLFITLGGTVIVTVATFPRERLVRTWEAVQAAVAEPTDPEQLIQYLKHLARTYRLDGPPGLEAAAASAPAPEVRHLLMVSLECHDADEIAQTLAGEVRAMVLDGEGSRQVVLTVAKLLPAFGLIGTLIGLVLLFRNLSGGDFASVAPGLGVAVLTTLYGAFLSNVIVLPIATKLQSYWLRQQLHLHLLLEGLSLVHRRELPTRIERALRSHLGTRYRTSMDPPALRIVKAA